MKTFLPVLVLITLLSTDGFASTDSQSADSYLSPQKKNVLLNIQSHLLNDKFTAAHQKLDSLIETAPDDPIGYLYKAAVYLAQMTDAEDNLYPNEFRNLIDTVRLFSAARLTGNVSPRETAWMNLCEGHARAYSALWESRFGSFTSALKQAFKARSSYEEGLRADTTLYDLYGGLGMFHYWKSAKAGVLRWIGVFKNEKDKGIGELRLAVDSSMLSREMARNALIWIWLDKKEYDSSVATCREMFETFPNGKVFLWPLAQAYSNLERYDLAIETYQILRVKLARSPGNYHNLIECDYNLNRCYDKLGLEKQAILAARGANAYYDSIPDATKRKQRNKLDFLRRFAKRDL